MAAGAFSRRKGKRPLMPMVGGVEAREANVTRGLFHLLRPLNGAERFRNRLRGVVAQRSGARVIGWSQASTCTATQSSSHSAFGRASISMSS